MTEIYKLMIALEPSPFSQTTWQRTIEIAANDTLEDLHFCIQEAVSFDNDHMYEFFVSGNAFGGERLRVFEMDMEEIFEIGSGMAEKEYVEDVSLHEVFPLNSGLTLFYLFDFGDSWLFRINKVGAAQAAADEEYPRITESKGKNPQQYPDFDELDD